jgi:hypothetical protein
VGALPGAWAVLDPDSVVVDESDPPHPAAHATISIPATIDLLM